MSPPVHSKIFPALRIGLACVCLVFFGCWSVQAQIFTNVTSGLRGVAQGSSVAGDIDGDGKLDLLVEGMDQDNYYATVWRNLGNSNFNDYADLNVCSEGTAYGSVAAGDFYNLGRLDAIVTGLGGDSNCNSATVSQLWHNIGNGNFNLVTNSGLLPSENGGVAVGDFNNDGKLDLLITGVTLSGFHIREFQNLGDGVFTNSTIGLTGGGIILAQDFDNDGYLDILYGTKFLKNLGNGIFTNIISGLPGNVLAVGDFDNDGYLDAVVANGAYQIWRNLGNGTFTNAGTILPAVPTPSGVDPAVAVVGDYDNDGYADLLLQTGTSLAPSVEIWRNLHNGNFTNTQSIVGSFMGTLTWADFNNDSRLDFLMTGQQGNQQSGAPIYVAQVWENLSQVSNMPPTAPPNLAAQTLGHGGVKLTWSAATDDHTPSSGLNYNIRVGSSPGGVDIVSPEADVATGFRRVVEIGNAQERLFSLLTNLSGGTYYWNVQAIDTAFAGGAFASEATFVIPATIASFGFGTNGQFQAGFNAVAGSSYTLQASTNLLDWTNAASVVPVTSGAAQLVDTNAVNFGRRYYRVKVP